MFLSWGSSDSCATSAREDESRQTSQSWVSKSISASSEIFKSSRTKLAKRGGRLEEDSEVFPEGLSLAAVASSPSLAASRPSRSGGKRRVGGCDGWTAFGFSFRVERAANALASIALDATPCNDSNRRKLAIFWLSNTGFTIEKQDNQDRTLQTIQTARQRVERQWQLLLVACCLLCSLNRSPPRYFDHQFLAHAPPAKPQNATNGLAVQSNTHLLPAVDKELSNMLTIVNVYANIKQH